MTCTVGVQYSYERSCFFAVEQTSIKGRTLEVSPRWLRVRGRLHHIKDGRHTQLQHRGVAYLIGLSIKPTLAMATTIPNYDSDGRSSLRLVATATAANPVTNHCTAVCFRLLLLYQIIPVSTSSTRRLLRLRLHFWPDSEMHASHQPDHCSPINNVHQIKATE